MLQSQTSHTEQQVLRHLHSVLSDSRRRLEGRDVSEEIRNLSETDNFALKAFTDNIAIGWPVHSDAESEFGSAFFRLAEFQFNMAINGYFVRGALSVGPAYVDEITVFGEALNEAYRGETILARDPRIILTQSAVERTRQHMEYYEPHGIAPHTQDILSDADGQWFLNYLDVVMIAVDEQGPFYDEFLQHRDAVEMKLKEHASNPAIWSKYAWVAGYHNYFCDINSDYFEEEHRINVELYRATPSRIEN